MHKRLIVTVFLLVLSGSVFAQSPNRSRFGDDSENSISRPDGTQIQRMVQNGREGLWDAEAHRWVFPCAFDTIENIVLQTGRYVNRGGLSRVVSYPSGFVRLRDKGLYGLGRIADGAIVLPCIYDGIEIYITKDSLLHLTQNGKYGLYRPFDGKLLPPVFDNRAELQYDGLISLYIHPDSSGYADKNLNIIVPPQYMWLEKYGPYIAAQADSLWGFYDRRGNLVQPNQYSRLNKIEGSNKLVAEKQGKWMLLDEDLQILGGPEFDFLDEDLLPGGCLQYGRHGWDSSLNCNVLWRGLIDTFGQVVRRAEFLNLRCCNGDRFVLADSAAQQFGIFSADMRMLAPFVYDRVRCTRSGHFIVKKGEKYGLLDHDGRPLIEPEYDNIEEGDGSAVPLVLGKNGRYAFADRNGRLLTDFEFDFADGFRSGRAAVRRNGLWGYADSTGQVVIPLQYTFADKFGSNGRAWVLDKDKWLQINATGKVILEKAPFNFDHERGYLSDTAGLRDSYGRLVLQSDSLAVSRPEGAVCRYRLIRPDSGLRYGLMNPDGRLLTPRIFDAVHPDMRFNYAETLPVRRGTRWGYLHVSGKMTIPFQFEKAAPFDRSGQAEVVLNGKTFVIDMSGKCVKNCE